MDLILPWRQKLWLCSVWQTDITDLKERVARIIVAYSRSGKPVTAGDLHAEGAVAALLKGRTEAESGADTGRNACICSWRSVCKYRPWMQQCDRDKDGTEAG
jgi:hypothetical protein